MSGRPRSTWGWGWQDRFPERSEREALGAQVAALLGGVEGLDAREPATPRLAESRVHCPLPFASQATEARALKCRGRGFVDLVRGFEGDFSTAPDVVLSPADEDEVGQALAWGAQAGVAVVPFGGGTSVVGGVEHDGEGYAGVAALCLDRMDRVLEVDVPSRSARIQAGATGPGLEAQLAEHGLTLRHYPQSFEFSTLGGWIATRAGGHFATTYTHIDDLVQAVRMVTPAGVWASRRVPGSGAGPSPDRWVCGSEGILGVITEAWMRVRPRPVHRARATVHFDDFSSGVAACRAVVQAGLHPSNCRLLDGREALVSGVAAGVGAVLLLGFESAELPQEASLQAALGLSEVARGGLPRPPVIRDGGERARADSGAEQWRQAFLEGPYRQSVLVSLGLVADTFETAITWDRFDALHADVIAAVKGAAGPPSLVSCRFTHVYPDGPAPYYTFVAPAGHGHQLERWRAIKEAASEALDRHGATITHHHAVGRLHRPWYDRQRPPPFAAALRAAKGAIDPAWVLNPGVLVDREHG